MAKPLPIPPPGFDELSSEEKVSYVQSLWDLISADESKIPVPDWHRSELKRRLRDRKGRDVESRSWDEVRSELRRNLNSDRGE